MKSRLQTLFLLVTLGSTPLGCCLFVGSHHDVMQVRDAQVAAESGDVAKLQVLLGEDPSLVKAKEWSSLTLLHMAVLHNHKQAAAFLLEKGANVNAKNSSGITPLHEAAQNGNKEIAELLLAHHARINAVDDNGWTPLDRAAKWNKPELVQFLKDHGGHEGSPSGH